MVKNVPWNPEYCVVATEAAAAAAAAAAMYLWWLYLSGLVNPVSTLQSFKLQAALVEGAIFSSGFSSFCKGNNL